MAAQKTDPLLRAGRAQQRILRARRDRDDAICEAYAEGASLHEIARATDITRPAVRKIIRSAQERPGSRLNPVVFSFGPPEPTTEAERKLAALVAEGEARVRAS